MKKRWLAMVMAFAMALSLLPVSAFATEENPEVPDETLPSYVAQITTGEGESATTIQYKTLDEAITAAEDGATIELLADCTTAGMNLEKDLTIQGAESLDQKPTVTFTDKGIALWGKALTFKDCNVVMNGIVSTPYTAEWNWMAICASTNASLSLDNVIMTIDAQEVSNSNTHAIYFCSNNKLNINKSTLTIKNYKQDALEWDGGDGGYNVNITDSTYISDHNRSGITGTFVVTIDKSEVQVVNSTGNGSNGSHFDIKNESDVEFVNNEAHGLSAGRLTVENSTVLASGNGGNGVHTNATFIMKNGADLTIKDNGCTISSQWTIPGALHIGNVGNGESSIDATSKLTIQNNRGSGILLKAGSLNVEDDADIDIRYNTAEKLGYGGGVNTRGNMVLPVDAVLYNNHAGTAGDDLWVENDKASIKFGEVGDGWYLDGVNGEETHCKDKIDGWYYDGYRNTGDTMTDEEVEDKSVPVIDDMRWNAHSDEPYVNLYEVSTEPVAGTLALKAAHGLIGSIVGTVFEDIGRDNKYVSEATENVKADEVFASVTVELWQNGEKMTETTTNANGEYRFDELAPGEYEVRIAKTPDGMNRDCAVVEDEQGNKFENNAATVSVKANVETRANAGFYYKSSGGGGGGSTKPPVLNTEDHYGYIIGYPVDYYTGEKTNDQTRMPVKPEGNITRAEVATIFFRMMTDDSRNQFWSQTNSYSDVSEEQWFNNAISTLANAGILDGYEDGTFRPNGKITRAEFAAIASRFFQYADKNMENPFSDVEEDTWYYQYIMAASDMGLINGYPDGTFLPNNPITRAESCAIVNRTLDRHPDQEYFLEDMLVWVDNMDTGKWYYKDMQEATNSHEYQMKTSSDGKYELWTKMLPIRDWAAFEKEWSDANSATGGEVVK